MDKRVCMDKSRRRECVWITAPLAPVYGPYTLCHRDLLTLLHRLEQQSKRPQGSSKPKQPTGLATSTLVFRH